MPGILTVIATDTTWPHRATGPVLLVLCGLLAACAAIPQPVRIALLAPFEGRYREIGYEALYAAHLAIQDSGSTAIELLPVDDGGSPANAADPARALSRDPQVVAVLVMGYPATESATQLALDDLPVLIVGDWGAQPVSQHTLILSNPAVADLLTIPARIQITAAARLEAPFTGGEILALAQYSQLRPSLDGISVVSSAALPSPEFAQRYKASNSFAPEPGLLASLTYDAARMAAAAALASHAQRSLVHQILTTTTYTGMNGIIRFEDGYWIDAPIHQYVYDSNGRLLPVDDLIK